MNMSVEDDTNQRTAANNSQPLNQNKTDDIPPQIAMRAVEWFVDLQEDPGLESNTRKSLKHWLNQDPIHERAWRHIETVNGRFGVLDSMVGKSVAHASVTHSRMISRREMIKALSVVLFAGGTAWTAKEQTPWQQWVADERTSIGERRTITLTDGSTIDMNTDSALNVFNDSNQQEVRLVRGEILVSMNKKGQAKTPSPLVVKTSQGNLFTSNARFSIRDYDETCSLSVFDGEVEIKSYLANQSLQTIKTGEQVHFSKDRVHKIKSVSPSSIAWSNGMIVASSMRLEDFLAELGRHRHGRLRCAEDIAELRVSGTYPLASTDRVLTALETSLSVKVHYMTRFFVTVKSATS